MTNQDYDILEEMAGQIRALQKRIDDLEKLENHQFSKVGIGTPPASGVTLHIFDQSLAFALLQQYNATARSNFIRLDKRDASGLNGRRWDIEVIDATGAWAGELMISPVDSNACRYSIRDLSDNLIFGVDIGNRLATIGYGVGSAALYLDGAAGNGRDFALLSGGSPRWILRGDSDAESGGDAGSTLRIVSRTDAGAYKAAVLSFDRATGEVYTTAWQDYAGSSTVIGWSSFTEKNIEIARIGKWMFVNFRIAGTSNSTSCYFSLPFSENHVGNPIAMIRATNASGTPVISFGQFTSATIFSCYPTPGAAATGWTASGSKAVYGQFIYQTT